MVLNSKGDVAGRHEKGFIENKNKLYLIGGGNLPTTDVQGFAQAHDYKHV